MDRRAFFRNAGVLGITAVSAGRSSQSVASGLRFPVEQAGESKGGGVKYVPEEPDVMKGSPPPPNKQVTRENREDSQAKLRWAMQHWRELYPTQRVRRSDMQLILPRSSRDIRTLTFADTAGRTTTVERQLDRLDVNAIIVVTRGSIVFEEYRHGMTPDTPHATLSAYKSIVATVLATLIDQGTLEENKPIESYVPELIGTAFNGATLRQLLDMESGAKYEYVGPDNELFQHEQSIAPEARLLGRPVGSSSFLPTLKKDCNHGERMRYKEADPLALAWAAEKTTGKRFADLLHDQIWDRMGAEFDADATCDPLGQWTFYLSVTLRDLARWGLMCLNDGTLNGQRIVPAGFFQDIRLNASVQKLAEAPLLGKFFPEGVGYRSFFYHHQKSGAIAAAGGFGQFCYINRTHETVVAFFSATPPWGTQDATAKDFEKVDIFARDCLLERERWHLCHQIAETS